MLLTAFHLPCPEDRRRRERSAGRSQAQAQERCSCHRSEGLSPRQQMTSAGEDTGKGARDLAAAHPQASSAPAPSLGPGSDPSSLAGPEPSRGLSALAPGPLPCSALRSRLLTPLRWDTSPRTAPELSAPEAHTGSGWHLGPSRHPVRKPGLGGDTCCR